MNARGKIKEAVNSTAPGAQPRHPRVFAVFNTAGFSLAKGLEPKLESFVFKAIYEFERHQPQVAVINKAELLKSLRGFVPTKPAQTAYPAEFLVKHPRPKLPKAIPATSRATVAPPTTKRKRSERAPSVVDTAGPDNSSKTGGSSGKIILPPSKKPRVERVEQPEPVEDRPASPAPSQDEAPRSPSPEDSLTDRAVYVAVNAIRDRFNDLVGTIVTAELQLLDLARREEQATGLPFGTYDGGVYGAVVAPLSVGQYSTTWRVARVSDEGRRRVPSVVAGRARRPSQSGSARDGEGEAGPSA